MARRILSIGQCGFDSHRIASFLQAELGALTDSAGTAEQADEALARHKYDLVLVNRVFDWSGESGIDFIARLKQAGVQTPIMLVSNYQDAQAQALAVGAVQGFGKSMLGTPQAANLLHQALATASEQA